eukprot:m.15684 g.15684  ORF g.15684 m.15684 type:complete len:161 (-) comp4508_c0_seq1:111-593(-)
MPLLSKIIFEYFDKNKSGTIDVSELKMIAEEMGCPLKDEDVEKSLQMIDKNHDGMVSYDEFQQWWQKRDRFSVLQEELEKQDRADHLEQWLEGVTQHFNFFDKDKSGFIHAHEFEALYNNLKQSYNLGSMEEARAMLDENNDGVISLQEYLRWLRAQRSH